MLLAIDIGNTNLVIGCVHDDKILFKARIATDRTSTVWKSKVCWRHTASNALTSRTVLFPQWSHRCLTLSGQVSSKSLGNNLWSLGQV